MARRLRAIRTLVLLAALLTATATANPAAEAPDPELRAVLMTAVEISESFEDRYDAEVWLTDMSGRLERRIPDPVQRVALLRYVHREATRAQLSPELVLAVIEVESNFDPYAISSAGALGLMQVMPFWLHEIGRPADNLFHIPTNLRFGCTILKHYLDKERGNLSRALARYNGSLGRDFYPNRVMSALDRRWLVP
ncbi:MAG: lytic transglycosylase domain-containing protein [Pseudomonadota bacterium]|nr:lytic transglycosylase domain-containing protein [Pseudomonadota bacterium]